MAKDDKINTSAYNLPSNGDNILIILGQEVSHLAGVEGIYDGKWYDKEFSGFEKLLVNELIEIKDKIKNSVDPQIHSLIAKFVKKVPNNVYVYDLSPYNLGSLVKLKTEATHTLQSILEFLTKQSKLEEKDRSKLSYQPDNYSKLVDMMNKCEHLVYIGEINQSLDFRYFVDDFSSIHIVTNNEDFEFKTDVKDIKDEDKFFFIHKGLSLENITKALETAKEKATPFKIDYSNPYPKDIKEKIASLASAGYLEFLNRFKKANPINSKLVNKLKKLYPFLKEYDDLHIEGWWAMYAKDTTRAGRMNEIPKEDFFIDMLLLYTLLAKDPNWNFPNQFLLSRPKTSLIKAICTKNKRDISRFRLKVKKTDPDWSFNHIKR